MAVIIQELIVQTKVVDDLNNKNNMIDELLKQVQTLKIQVKELKDKIERENDISER